MADIETGPHPAGTFCWHNLGTTDREAAGIFYAEVLGWSPEEIPMPGEAGSSYTMMHLGAGDIAGSYTLGPEEQAQGIPPHWGQYIAVDDVDAVAKKAAALGATLCAEPFDIPGVGRMAMLSDPTGAAFCLWRRSGPHHGTAHFGDLPGSGCWHELVTDDTEKAAAFYAELFGWEIEKRTMEGMAYTVFKLGDTQVGGMMAKTEEMGSIPSAWVVYFLVSDAAAAIRKAESLGGRCFFPPVEAPGIGTFTWLADGQGALFGIVQPPASE